MAFLEAVEMAVAENDKVGLVPHRPTTGVQVSHNMPRFTLYLGRVSELSLLVECRTTSGSIVEGGNDWLILILGLRRQGECTRMCICVCACTSARMDGRTNTRVDGCFDACFDSWVQGLMAGFSGRRLQNAFPGAYDQA